MLNFTGYKNRLSKGLRLALCLTVVFKVVFGNSAFAAICSDVFPVNTTSSATVSQQLSYSYPGGQSFDDFFYLLSNSIGTGDRYYNGRTMLSDIEVTAGSTTRLFVNGDLILDSWGNFIAADVNAGGDPADLILIVNGDLSISNKSEVNALIYVQGDVTVIGNPTINGAITATGSAPSAKTNQTYDADAAANADFSTLCSVAGPSFDHFNISVPSTASTCGTAAVVITAQDASNATVTDFVDTITLSTSSNHGGWAVTAGANSISDSDTDDGAATYLFDLTDAGQVTLALTNSHADILTVTAVDSLTSTAAVSSGITFSDNAFNISTASVDVIAGRDHSFNLEYLKKDPVTGDCGTASDFTGSVNLKMSYSGSVNHPAGAAAPTVSSVTLPSTQPASNNLTLSFASGLASFTLSSTDIGEYRFDVLDDSSGLAVDVSGSPINIAGSSADYSVRPFGLAIAVPANPAASSATGGVFKKAGELFNVQVSGVLYQSSDDGNGDGIPDGHDDNDPSNNADLSDNTTAPSFGAEGESVASSSTLILPALGNDPGLSGTTTISTFSSGSGDTSTATRFDEVGIVEISAAISDGTYLSSTGITIYGKSGYLGRFTPAYFSASANIPILDDGWYDYNSDGSNDWSCTFTYQGQGFAMDVSPRLTLTALNASGITTQNYTANFNKLFSASVSDKNIHYVISDNVATTGSVPTISSISITINDLAGGLIDLVINGLNDGANGLSYTKSVQPSAGDEAFFAEFSVYFFQELTNTSPSLLTVDDPGEPSQPIIFVSEIQTYFDDSAYLNTDTNSDGNGDTHQDLVLRDADNICYMIDTNADGIVDQCDEFVISGIIGTEIRYGRLSIDNAYGSELLPLSMIYRAEYYDLITPTSPTSGFKINDQDNSNISACAGSIVSSAEISLSDFQLNLNGGETALSSTSGLSDGLGSLILSAPGTGNQGMVKVNISVPSWLQYDFDGDGAADQPSAIASFGVSAGDGIIFYLKENFR